ncbi:MAG: sigma-70 family RNA polymerase sigma factor [Thermoleophilia bacterium]|nr:sigma-70 family RNA polymerase sigma factor [Thermoleophilia bacterium]
MTLTSDSDIRDAYRAHSGELYGFACRSLRDTGLAEEAVQETFLRAWRAGDRFDPDLASLRTWLFAIIRNVVIDLSHKASVQIQPTTDTDDRSEDPFDRALTAWQVEEALRRIGDQHRQALIEIYFKDRPYDEVAAELGIPEGTVKSRVYYGLRAMSNVLDELGFDE